MCSSPLSDAIKFGKNAVCGSFSVAARTQGAADRFDILSQWFVTHSCGLRSVVQWRLVKMRQNEGPVQCRGTERSVAVSRLRSVQDWSIDGERIGRLG